MGSITVNCPAGVVARPAGHALAQYFAIGLDITGFVAALMLRIGMAAARASRMICQPPLSKRPSSRRSATSLAATIFPISASFSALVAAESPTCLAQRHRLHAYRVNLPGRLASTGRSPRG